MKNKFPLTGELGSITRMTTHRTLFLTIRAEGALLPVDLLQRIVDNDHDLGGLTYVERKEYFGMEMSRYTLQRKGA